MGEWSISDPDGQESSLSYYAGIFAGRLTQFAKHFDVKPADVLAATRSDAVEVFTHVENEDPHKRCLSFTSENLRALKAALEDS